MNLAAVDLRRLARIGDGNLARMPTSRWRLLLERLTAHMRAPQLVVGNAGRIACALHGSNLNAIAELLPIAAAEGLALTATSLTRRHMACAVRPRARDRDAAIVEDLLGSSRSRGRAPRAGRLGSARRRTQLAGCMRIDRQDLGVLRGDLQAHAIASAPMIEEISLGTPPHHRSPQ